MSLPSWLKNGMGSPNPQGDLGSAASQALGQALCIAPQQPLNGYPGGAQQMAHDLAAQSAMITGQSIYGPLNEYTHETRAVGNPLDAIAVRMTNRLIDKMPVTAAAKISRLEVRMSGGVGEVLVVFAELRRNPTQGGPLSLPMTDDFPTDADISRILLAMP